MRVLESFFTHQFLHIGRACPRIFRHLVAARMEERNLHTRLLVHQQNLVNHLFKETVCTLLRRIQHIVMVALSRSVPGSVVPIPQPVTLGLIEISLLILPVAGFHRNDGSTGMSRSLDFRHNPHASIMGIFQQLDKFLTRYVAIGSSRQIVRITVTGIELAHKSIFRFCHSTP